MLKGVDHKYMKINIDPLHDIHVVTRHNSRADCLLRRILAFSSGPTDTFSASPSTALDLPWSRESILLPGYFQRREFLVPVIAEIVLVPFRLVRCIVAGKELSFVLCHLLEHGFF